LLRHKVKTLVSVRVITKPCEKRTFFVMSGGANWLE
jgi:hypothetical protein